MMFSLWAPEKLREAIVNLEENLSLGVNSVSNPAQGSISYSSRLEGKKILADMWAAYRAMTGAPLKANKIKIFALRRDTDG